MADSDASSALPELTSHPLVRVLLALLPNTYENATSMPYVQALHDPPADDRGCGDWAGATEQAGTQLDKTVLWVAGRLTQGIGKRQ
jgi:hypothetical protein